MAATSLHQQMISGTKKPITRALIIVFSYEIFRMTNVLIKIGAAKRGAASFEPRAASYRSQFYSFEVLFLAAFATKSQRAPREILHNQTASYGIGLEPERQTYALSSMPKTHATRPFRSKSSRECPLILQVLY